MQVSVSQSIQGDLPKTSYQLGRNIRRKGVFISFFSVAVFWEQPMTRLTLAESMHRMRLDRGRECLRCCSTGVCLCCPAHDSGV